MPWRPSRLSNNVINPVAGHVVNQVLRETNARIDDINAQANKRISSTSTLNFGAVSANTCKDRTMHVTGVNQHHVSAVNPVGGLLGSSQIHWSSFVSGANQVTVRLCNPTTGSITVVNAPWRVIAS